MNVFFNRAPWVKVRRLEQGPDQDRRQHDGQYRVEQDLDAARRF
jgi:hypothetical protein